jgi:hypothetical protein
LVPSYAYLRQGVAAACVGASAKVCGGEHADRERQLIAHLQAARTDVQGYENLHGYKLRFETTWLDK